LNLQPVFPFSKKAKNEFFDKMRNFEADLELARQDNEDLEEAKENLEKELAKAKNDISAWKRKFEEEGQAKAEELEIAR
jgi:Tfp pilus assembly protein PilF